MKYAAAAMMLMLATVTGCTPPPPETPPTVLTVESSADLRALLRGPATGKSVEAFTDKYRRDPIKFDGVVVDVYHSAGGSMFGDSWIDVMAGSASDPKHTGPVFRIGWIDSPANPAIWDFEKDDDVRVSGGVGHLDPYKEVVSLLDGDEKGGLTRR